MGTLASVLIAAMTSESFVHARRWIGPLMSAAMYTSRRS
jgi:hypothetical protein